MKYEAIKVDPDIIPRCDPNIEKELSKHSAEYVLSFFRLHKSKNYRGTITISSPTPIIQHTPFYYSCISRVCWVHYDSIESFWTNWNRYKNLKAFL